MPPENDSKNLDFQREILILKVSNPQMDSRHLGAPQTYNTSKLTLGWVQGHKQVSTAWFCCDIFLSSRGQLGQFGHESGLDLKKYELLRIYEVMKSVN